MADYIIGPQRRSITCLKCNKTSWNSQDVEHLFCGFCNRFHLDQAIEQPTPDNSVYVKSGQTAKATERNNVSEHYTATQVAQMQAAAAKQSVDRARIEELARTDATIHSCLVMVRNGVLTYEAALEGLVVLLHQQKEAAVAVAVDANARALPPLLVADPNQAPLQLGAGESIYQGKHE